MLVDTRARTRRIQTRAHTFILCGRRLLTPRASRRRLLAAAFRALVGGSRAAFLATGSIATAALATGTFLSPHDLRPLLDPAMGRYVISATARDLNIRGVTDPRTIAEELWPAEPIDSAYDVIATAIRQDDPTAHADVRRILLADALESALRDDPLIPLDLRRSPWRPAMLRRTWLECWNDIAPSAAYSAWDTVTASAG